MTPIRYSPSPRWRQSEVVTREAGRVRALAVALEPSSLLIRPKGTRQTLRLPFSLAYQLAARLEADRIRAERKSRRAAGRKGGAL